ncbi:Protein kinase-like domain [Pseudocohnilembus persalinus]|uniref:Protein kinase-like domain n=1 Tax=Pseudocohnilembus persalinus TaxID=266149 RepID=A0A0V0QW84_PSEPJ|nr:Protein kinase-like domain [Pseudocohnilembus persalinus]|eukprot:KRX06272.1 Protein kinase-like domain [Pseudocohnilembus persalinus]
MKVYKLNFQLHNQKTNILQSICHRDIKPSNILIFNKGGNPLYKVADLGSIKTLKKRAEQTLTSIKGTPSFLPQEVAYENIDNNINFKSVDIYSLGLVLLLVSSIPNVKENEIFNQSDR